MPQHLVCPGCKFPLVIQDYAPARLTCPRCLTSIRNPHPMAVRPTPDATRVPTHIRYAPPPNWRPPDFAAHDAQKDIRGTNYAIVALAVTLAGGAVISFAAHSPGVGIILVLASLISIALPIAHARVQQDDAEPSVATEIGYRIVKAAAAVVVALFTVLVLLFGLCCAMVAGGSIFHW